MTPTTFRLNPIAIGGLGGSGTRLIAGILARSGCYIGQELNHSLDNLWFTLLLRRQSWFRDFPPDQDIRTAIRLFRIAMVSGLGNHSFTSDEKEILEQTTQEITRMKAQSPKRLQTVADSLRNSQSTDCRSYARWGWKEPNTHIFLPYLADIIPGLKYVHVVRNGLDMAFSDNQNQLKNWGRYILGPEFSKTPSASQKLDFWIVANLRAIQTGREKLGNNLFVLDYDELCTMPEKTLPALLGFLETPGTADKYTDLISPVSLGRHKSEDCSFLSEKQKQSVAFIHSQISH